MAEDSININKNSRIPLSRNAPVALIVGVAGFLGSFLAEKLLSKNIQVVGVDNFSTGRRDNLEQAVRDKNFHLLVDSAERLDIDLSRLDYLFITAGSGWDITSVLELFKEKKCRLLFVSSIDLYSTESSPELSWFKETEGRIARLAQDKKLNARILRLGPLYGPRMNFSGKEPVSRLIQAALNDQLQKDIPLEFSTRALYIDDAVDLAVKSVLVGATAQKIFDGVSPAPIPIAEIKQVLLDPIWYENKNFVPTELPPWRTPNLEKTIKFLNWQPKSELVASLKETLHYFKQTGLPVPKLEEKLPQKEESVYQDDSWRKGKQQELESLKPADLKEKEIKKKNFKLVKFRKSSFSLIYLLLLVVLVTYALIWPVVSLGAGVFIFQYNLNKATESLQKGDLQASSNYIKQSKNGIEEARGVIASFATLRQVPFLQSQFKTIDGLTAIADSADSATESAGKGIDYLYQSLKAVTGEINQPSNDFFSNSQSELTSADEELARLETKLSDTEFTNSLPKVVRDRLDSIKSKLDLYKGLVEKGRAAAILLPDIVALNGSKSYLILFQNNAELRPTGGFIGSVGVVNFESGKLKKIDLNDVYAIDGQLATHVEPPKEIKDDLGQKDWYLRDSNWEPDFPTSARQSEWFYTRETGQTVQGVIALDLTAAADLVGTVGTLDLTDYNEQVSADNLFEKAVTHAESGFFPGSQAKKTFLTALVNQLFNQLFFLPQKNWPGIVGSVGKSLESKHISIYLNDPKLFSYLAAQNWTNTLPRPAASVEGYLSDLLVPVEANLGADKANFYLDRSYNLDTTIGKEGDVTQRLKVTYLNSSPGDVFPAGTYKNRMRAYLPFGSKLIRALWGDTDITKDVNGFVDYGRSGFSFLITLAPKERKSLVLDYTIPGNLSFKEGKAVYRLDIIKQAGTLKDPFVWNLFYPINYKIQSTNGATASPQEQTITTDLSTDRSFEVTFSK